MKQRGNIPGWVNYAVLAQKHRPADRETFAAEVRRLSSTGLQPRDIAEALRTSLADVMEILRGDR